MMFLSDGSSPPSFTGSVVAASYSNAITVIGAFIDSDSCMDLVAAQYDGSWMSWFRSDCASTPTFNETMIANTPQFTGLVETADLNNDGVVDIVRVVNILNVIYYLSSGGVSPTFTAYTLFTTSVGAYGVTLADINGDGAIDMVFPMASSVQVYQSDGGAVPKYTGRVIAAVTMQTVPNPFLTTSRVVAGDMNADGAIDFVSSMYVVNGTKLAWYQNMVCTRGQYSGSGNFPCSPCPAGTFGASMGLVTAQCSGYCPAGQYSTGGAASCQPCPSGRYGDVVGLASALCAGPCVASAGSGNGCDVGATAPTGSTCRVGMYSSGGGCVACPAGRYGDTAGATSATCAGACVAAAGRYCGAGATTATGAACPPGQYSDAVGASVCTACPAGVYGASAGLTSSNCTSDCVAPAGSYCPAGATASTGLVCPKGTYSTGGGSASCTPCPAGRFGSTSNLTSSNCSGLCAPGNYSYAGAEACSVCPNGTAGTSAGLNSSACSGRCTSPAGSYCAGSGTALCPNGYYSGGERGHVSVLGTFVPHACNVVLPCFCLLCAVNAAACTKCSAGRLGNVTGLASSNCSGLCPAGQFSLAGSSACTSCPLGRYGTSTGLSTALCSGLCPPSTFGNTTGLTNASCSGACIAGPGTYCPAGATSSTPIPCPPGRYSATGGVQCDGCPAGANCSSASTTSTMLCAAGQYSVAGASCVPCPAGVFGNASGESCA